MIRRLILTLATLTLGATAAHAGTVPVTADGIYSARAADAVCLAAEASARWNGNWVTTEWGQMSVCGCTVETSSARTTFDVEAGPIWNNGHAQQICPSVCDAPRWTGGYSFADRRSESTCTLDYPGRIRGAVKVEAFARPTPVRVVVSPRVFPRPARHRVVPVHRSRHATWRAHQRRVALRYR